MDEISKYLSRISQETKEIIRKTVSSKHHYALCKCCVFESDLSTWISILKSEPQLVLYQSALNECATANFLCSQGLYKHSFISLRLCLEHLMFGVFFSTNDFYFRKWKAGISDIGWATITDADNGLFSHEYFRAYAPEFIEMKDELLAIAKSVYRECSEFVHGNFEKVSTLPSALRYEESLLEMYLQIFESVAYLITITLFVRYNEKIKQEELHGKLESAIIERIGILPQIQQFYGSK